MTLREFSLFARSRIQSAYGRRTPAPAFNGKLSKLIKERFKWSIKNKSKLDMERTMQQPTGKLFSTLIMATVTGAILCTTIAPAFSSQSRHSMTALLRCTRDQAIFDALTAMAGSPGEPMLDLVVSKPVRIFFKDMGQLNKKLKDFDALSWITTDGQMVIFINKKHQDAPAEAIAALISHESIHNDIQNSIHEEIAGWRQEAMVWSAMKRRNPSLADIPAKKYPLVDRLNRIEQEYHQGTLAQFVRGNPGYKGLPESSPGFFEQASPETTAYHQTEDNPASQR
jgi:hypothetical protein